MIDVCYTGLSLSGAKSQKLVCNGDEVNLYSYLTETECKGTPIITDACSDIELVGGINCTYTSVCDKSTCNVAKSKVFQESDTTCSKDIVWSTNYPLDNCLPDKTLYTCNEGIVSVTQYNDEECTQEGASASWATNGCGVDPFPGDPESWSCTTTAEPTTFPSEEPSTFPTKEPSIEPAPSTEMSSAIGLWSCVVLINIHLLLIIVI